MKPRLYGLYFKIAAPAAVVLILAAFLSPAPKGRIIFGIASSSLERIGLAQAATETDQEASARAFLKAYQVFQHPRCVNCHPAGDRPLQGDKEQIHTMHIVRGPEGMGKNGVWCSTCHQNKNLEGAGMPPGTPGWQMPTADMPMVFEGRSPKQLCEQLKNPGQNGHRSPAEVLDHVRDAPLVKWGWDPGEGRTPAPLTHEEFVSLMKEWIDKGQACPE